MPIILEPFVAPFLARNSSKNCYFRLLKPGSVCLEVSPCGTIFGRPTGQALDLTGKLSYVHWANLLFLSLSLGQKFPPLPDSYPQAVRLLDEFLAKVLTNSLTTAVAPTDSHLATICSVHKKGLHGLTSQLPLHEFHTHYLQRF